MFGRGGFCEVLDFVRVGREVVEFFLGRSGLTELLLRGREFPLGVKFREERPYGILLLLVFVVMATLP